MVILPDLETLQWATDLVHSVLLPTPQIRWPLLCARVGAEVWVKHENHNPTGAFKIRGGIVYLEALKKQERGVSGVIAATRGNHGQSIALAAARLGVRAVIVVPYGNSPEKNAAMRAFGVTLIEHGRDFQEALEYASDLSKTEHLHFVPSIHERLVAGVASYAIELFGEVNSLDAVYVPIGLGSGISGVIAARNALGLKTDIVGVTASSAPAYARSFEEGRPVSAEVEPTIADGMACRTPDAGALETIRTGVCRIVAVDEPEIKMAMRHLFTDTHNVAEGAGASGLAALLKERERMQGRKVAVVQTGGNVDRDVFASVLTAS